MRQLDEERIDIHIFFMKRNEKDFLDALETYVKETGMPPTKAIKTLARLYLIDTGRLKVA